jgi:predicted ester cyclase
MPTPQEALAAAHASWNAGDLDGYLELYDDSIQLYMSSTDPMDKPAVTAFYQAIHAAFGSPPPLEFHEVLWAGDVATIRFTMHGTHVGEFMGVPPTGAQIALGGITTLRFAGDRVVERWSQADMLGLLVQLGAVPAPA